MLEKQQYAPMFRALNQNNQLVSLTDYAGEKNLVLYFYPKDDTPGCTIEANQFTQLADEFAQLDTVIIGISKDSCESHSEFIKKYALKVELLADTRGEMCENYGVWREREKEGVKSMAIFRSTFIVDKHGVLAEVIYGVTPEGHAQEILEKIKNLGKSAAVETAAEETAAEEVTEAAADETTAEAQ
ncbi:peroxiredoxin [Methylovulum psychrotolerans]|uniref:thioredoxin-dependent peroxiredoxin n=1 Tax=Methylovulum psychrotolerans TaxID=1704499 RepID=A0A1Z4BUY7_9GAMM|nr:peroxiredoxin [Methylovulum psychrotolerans]ASF45078.1 peroxiredoxin [Methylovulum psychrotolerans]